MEEEMKKKIEEVIVNPLNEYINDKHTQEETIGFIDGFAEGFVDGAKYRDSLANQWASEETFTRTKIEQLQNEVHKITGNGEVMQLFNKMLGNSTT